MDKETSAVIILVVLAICYSIGVMVDGVTAALEDPVSLLKPRRHDGCNFSIMRLKYPNAYDEFLGILAAKTRQHRNQ